MTRAIQHLQDALARADLHTPPYPDALQRLTDVVVQGREYYVFWNHAEWVRMIDARTETADLPLPSFYGQTLETFFLNGQKAGAFGSMCRPCGWCGPTTTCCTRRWTRCSAARSRRWAWAPWCRNCSWKGPRTSAADAHGGAFMTVRLQTGPRSTFFHNSSTVEQP